MRDSSRFVRGCRNVLYGSHCHYCVSLRPKDRPCCHSKIRGKRQIRRFEAYQAAQSTQRAGDAP